MCYFVENLKLTTRNLILIVLYLTFQKVKLAPGRWKNFVKTQEERTNLAAIYKVKKSEQVTCVHKWQSIILEKIVKNVGAT